MVMEICFLTVIMILFTKEKIIFLIPVLFLPPQSLLGKFPQMLMGM